MVNAASCSQRVTPLVTIQIQTKQVSLSVALVAATMGGWDGLYFPHPPVLLCSALIESFPRTCRLFHTQVTGSLPFTTTKPKFSLTRGRPLSFLSFSDSDYGCIIPTTLLIVYSLGSTRLRTYLVLVIDVLRCRCVFIPLFLFPHAVSLKCSIQTYMLP